MKNKLLKEYPYRTELHAHTSPASNCSEISPTEIVDIYAKLGYNAIVITNHFCKKDMPRDELLDFYLADYERAYEYARDKGINVILGTELTFTENGNDYLIFGVDREILSTCVDYFEKGIETFRKEVVLPESVFVMAHPFRKNIVPVDAALLDGVEIFNMHPNHNSNNSFAVRFAAENGIAIKTAGTDFHHLGHQGAAALRTKTIPEDSFDIARILKSGDYILEIGEDSIVLP